MHGFVMLRKFSISFALIIPVSIMIIMLLIPILGLTGCMGAESITNGQTTTKQTATSNTTTLQTATSSQTEKPGIFTKEDLTINSISYGATPDEFEKTLGAPLEKETTMDQVTGRDLLIYTYDGLQLIFKNDSMTDELFHLKIVEATIQGYRFTHDLQVGDSVQKIINSFAQEDNKDTYQGFTVIYGDPNLLDNENTASKIAFGYYNEKEANFLAMMPPYMSGYATVYDEMAVLHFTFENQAVTRIRWMLGPGAE